MPKGILPENAILTSSSGAYGKAVAQHMFAMLLAMQKNFICTGMTREIMSGETGVM